MTSQVFMEGELEFSFPEFLNVEKLDAQAQGALPQGMALVDFVVELEDRIFGMFH